MNTKHLAKILSKSSFFETVDSTADLIQRCKDYLNLDISDTTARPLLATLQTVFEFVANCKELAATGDSQTIELLQQDLTNSNNILAVLQQDLATANNRIELLQQDLTNSNNILAVLQQPVNDTIATKDKKILQQTLDKVKTVCNNDCNSNCNIGVNMELSLEQRLDRIESLVLPKPQAKKPQHPLNGEQLQGWSVCWQGRGWSVNKRYGKKIITRFVGKIWDEAKALTRINEYLNSLKQ